METTKTIKIKKRRGEMGKATERFTEKGKGRKERLEEEEKEREKGEGKRKEKRDWQR
jgi:hypothetical protein